MKSEKPSTDTSRLDFSISRFHTFKHAFALVLAFGLSLSLIMSELSYGHLAPGHFLHHLKDMFVPYAAMTIFVVLITVSNILAVRQVKISAQDLIISSLFWEESLKGKGSFTSPPQLKFAWLKTRHCFYLFSKNEFKNWQQLQDSIKQYLEQH